jgi:hypothetical protein
MLDELEGVWGILSFQFEVVGEGRRVDALGARPTGRVIIAQGYFTACVVASERKIPTNVAETAALIRSMVAYTGKTRIEGGTFITTVDASWNELFTGTEQVRQFEISGNTLRIKGAPGPSLAFPGKQVIGHLIFEREA